jgi:hypothetical protein
MATNYNSKIITNGLRLCLDAANVKSYPGTGTTWFDQSGNSNNSTMYGTVPYTTVGGTCFNFATVTGSPTSAASMGFTFASNMIPTTGNFTLTSWIYNPPVSASQIVLFSNAGGADGYRYGISLSNIYYLISGASSVGYQEGSINFLSTLSTSQWYHVSTIFNRTGSLGTPTIYLYLNGVFQNSITIPTSQPAFTNTAPGIVRATGGTTLYTGKLANFFAYGRELTPDEILTNFNATRARYGI